MNQLTRGTQQARVTDVLRYHPVTLADYYFHDPRLILVPIEQLTPDGVLPEFAALLSARGGWDARRIDLFNAAFSLYWSRSAALAKRTDTWAPPRIRHVGLVRDALALLPYVQLLNTSAWTLYESDVDPADSNPEFAAYLLVHGDRMALLGEVTAAALHNAAYWFDRSDSECAAFAAAAYRARRPDAAVFRLLAEAIPWLRQLSHDHLRPRTIGTRYRSIPGTLLSVPARLEALPPDLHQQWRVAAQQVVERFHAAWRASESTAVTALCDWLASSAPPLLVCARGGRILWDAESPKRVGAFRQEVRHASAAAVQDIAADLAVIAAHTRAFHGALTEPGGLRPPDPQTEQRGYVYLHSQRRLIAYNLHEPGIDRLHGPALPYARAMLGARTVHEWAHLAVDSGWVPQVAGAEHVADVTAALAQTLAATVAAAPRIVREQTHGNLIALVTHPGAPTLSSAAGTRFEDAAGTALVQLLLTRLPDYQANLLGQRFMAPAEQETYVRQNIRTLRHDYQPPELWRMLVRYLYEYHYLSFSAVCDRRRYFLSSTWFDADFLEAGILDEARFDQLIGLVAQLCGTFAVDERRFHAPA